MIKQYPEWLDELILGVAALILIFSLVAFLADEPCFVLPCVFQHGGATEPTLFAGVAPLNSAYPLTVPPFRGCGYSTTCGPVHFAFPLPPIEQAEAVVIGPASVLILTISSPLTFARSLPGSDSLAAVAFNFGLPQDMGGAVFTIPGRAAFFGGLA